MCMYVSTYLFIYLICIIYFSYLPPLSLSLSLDNSMSRQGRGPRPALTWARASFPNCHPAEGEIFVPLIPQFVVTSEVISRLFLCSRSTSSYGNTLQGLKWPLLWVGEGWRILVGLADCVIRASPAWGDVTTQQTPPSLGRGGQVGPPLTGAASPGKRGRRASWWSGACALPPWAGWGP